MASCMLYFSFIIKFLIHNNLNFENITGIFYIYFADILKIFKKCIDKFRHNAYNYDIEGEYYGNEI